MHSADISNVKESFFSRLGMNKKLRVDFITACVAITIIILISLLIPNFMTFNNIINLLEQFTTIGTLSIGLTLVMIVGGIDLSMPFVLISSACVGARHMADGGSILEGILLMLLVGVVFGTINGIAIAKFKMIPFIVTFSMMMIAEGFAVAFTNSKSIFGLPSDFLALGGRIGEVIPIPVLMVVILAIIATIFLSKTRHGRIYYMIGISEDTARVCGINTTLYKFSAYLLSGLLAAIAGIIVTARISMAGPTMVSDTTIMDTVSGCVIGGASLNGGKGKIVPSLIGALFIVCITNCTNLLGVSYYASTTIKGILICVIIGLDVIRSKY
ncbi:MAG: ABC transporter permease [Christensenellales bacterium]|jgi:ribose transport system permease protein